MISQVLLIDDDKINNYISESIIKKSGKIGAVKTYLNGRDAIDSLKSKNDNPQLILVDINMPVMDGLEFLEEYDNSITDPHSIIYLMHTSPLTPQQSEKLQNLPVSGNLLKPLTKEKFHSIIEKHFSAL